MKRNTYSISLILIFLLLLVLGLYSNQSVYSDKSNHSKDKSIPELNANEIIIITPKNKTYTKPMSGYYPGSFGFENEEDGASREEIAFVNYSGPIHSNCYVDIIGTYQGHNKVLRIYDGNTNGGAGATNYFDTVQTNGIIEWWWSTSMSGTGFIGFYLHEGLKDAYAGSVRIKDGNFIDMQNNTMLECNANQWYHHKLIFNTDSDTYDWYINGFLWVNDGSFENPVNNIGTIVIKGAWQIMGSCYIDAISYSWDPDYNVGDNMNEGLLLGFENSITLDWIGYSLDKSSNKTILGNTTIVMPTNGHHNIQVFGNDPLGTMYESSIRYFSISITNYIKIINPENTTYTSSMSGYYPATYGFENDRIGEINQNIAFVDSSISSSGCTAEIFDEIGNHKRILQVTDSNPSGQYDLFNQFDSNQQAGTIEYWIYTPDASLVSALNLYQNSEVKIFVRISDDYFQYRQPNAQFANICPALDNTWNHVRIDFECGSGGYMGLSADTFFIWINEIQYGPYSFRYTATAIDELRLASNEFEDTSSAYYDAFGYSWDPDYNIGDNFDEGLLLSFDTIFLPDWLGYSLDGLTNRTILGNTTIQMPPNGPHNIQVFGNDTLGIRYSSNISYFSIDAFGPTILINKPTKSDIFGAIAPDFNITIEDLELNSTWYSLDNGVTIFYFNESTGSINQTEWDKQTDGPITISFYANDTFGRLSIEKVIVFKDILAPIITIYSPSVNAFFNEGPSFYISISDASLNTCWYTIDAGDTNITFTGFTGIINQSEWDEQFEGPITIRFYANDSFSRVSYKDVVVNKDTTDPKIMIYSPLLASQFTIIPPAFNISVDELNIDTVWYTIDGGLNIYYITQYNGYINTNAWNSAPIGAITIRFYARDEAGNIAFEEVIIQKMIPPFIPPDYSLIIIISVAIGIFIAVMSIFLVITLVKRRRIRPPKPPKPPKAPKPPKPQKPSKAELRRILIEERSKAFQKIPPTTPVIVQREVIVIEKKTIEKDDLERERKPVKCLYCGDLIDYNARICPKCGNEQK